MVDTSSLPDTTDTQDRLDHLRSTRLLSLIQKLLDGHAPSRKKDLERHKRELQRDEFDSSSSSSDSGDSQSESEAEGVGVGMAEDSEFQIVEKKNGGSTPVQSGKSSARKRDGRTSVMEAEMSIKKFVEEEASEIQQ
ncbi:hypothetical protein FGO68_gene6431 [Halteria grandinella]|uniref:Uncharacterized protein n=1 Tax=Halteria grandinella TaxID=5974 RepID=A0A8J8P0X4_HALGN|nr:hypothetical protein FGO68_gene6431 [Halteria grandinella]